MVLYCVELKKNIFECECVCFPLHRDVVGLKIILRYAIIYALPFFLSSNHL